MPIPGPSTACWTGPEITHVYERTDDGKTSGKATLELIDKHDERRPAMSISSAPGCPIRNGARPIARSRSRCGATAPAGYSQNRYFPETGTTDNTHRGLTLVPLAV